MKRAVLVGALLLMVYTGSASADHIGIYRDAVASSSCQIPPAFQPYTWYVVHQFSAGTTGSQWKINDATGQTQSGTAVQGGFLAIGNAYTGLSLAYGGCLTGGFVLVHLNYFGFPVPAAPCGKLEVVPDPSAGIIKYTNCSFVEVSATGGEAFNGDFSCGTCYFDPIESSTWGGVKALYR